MRKTPFCVSLLCFGGQNPSLVFNQRQLVEAIFAGICVCTSVWEAAASLHRDSPLEWAQFLAKTETNSWHRVEQLFFFFFPLSITCQSLRKPVSCLLGFHTLVLSLSDVCLSLNYLSLIHFNGTDFLKTFSSALGKKKNPGWSVRMCQYAKSQRVFFC